jgi:hypothetical protein
MREEKLHDGPLWNKDGSVAVDPRIPALKPLRLALERGVEAWEEKRKLWERANGSAAAARRILRKEYGLTKPMTEEEREEMRRYNEEHAEEIKHRRKLRKLARQAELDRIKADIKTLTTRRRR